MADVMLNYTTNTVIWLNKKPFFSRGVRYTVLQICQSTKSASITFYEPLSLHVLWVFCALNIKQAYAFT